jgi:hypothetical protein
MKAQLRTDKSVVVEAVRFNKVDEPRLKEVLPSKEGFVADLTSPSASENVIVPIALGDWILTHANGRKEVCNHADFLRRYIPPEAERAQEPATDPSLKLIELLKGKAELRDKLIEALATGRFLVTLSCQKRRTPDDAHDLQHFWTQTGYPLNDVVASLRHLAADFNAKQNPTAETGNQTEWV